MFCLIISQGNYEIVQAPDEYSIAIDSNRGKKEFQFDHIFMPDASQEDVFEDTNVSHIWFWHYV